MKSSLVRSPLRVTLLYAALAAVAVTGFNLLLHEWATAARQLLAFNIGLDWLKIAVSALVLYLLLVREQRLRRQAEEDYILSMMEEQRRRHQADTMLRVASVVGSTLDVDEVLDRILDQLQEVVDYDSASVQILQGDQLQVIAVRGFPVLGEVLGRTFPLTAA